MCIDACRCGWTAFTVSTAGNELTNDGVKGLVEGLKENKSLTELGLSEVCPCARPFALSLTHHRHVFLFYLVHSASSLGRLSWKSGQRDPVLCPDCQPLAISRHNRRTIASRRGFTAKPLFHDRRLWATGAFVHSARFTRVNWGIKGNRQYSLFLPNPHPPANRFFSRFVRTLQPMKGGCECRRPLSAPS